MATYSGTPGDDIFTGGVDQDSASGGAGNDSLAGSDGGDVLAGGAGSDTLDGGAGEDTLYSGEATPLFNLPYAQNPYSFPVLDTGTEVDTLNGGEGYDRIFAGYGDNVDGGPDGSLGDYLFISFQGAPTGVTADFGLATQTIGGGVIKGIENISYVQGSEFDDNINARSPTESGHSDFTAVRGMGGNDTLKAGYYTGSLFGDDGDDIVDGRLSQYLSLVDGGAGNDTVYGNNSGAAYGGAGDDLIYAQARTHGGAGDDIIVMQKSYYADLVYGDEGNDTITASESSNKIAGGAGADKLVGAGGADSLFSADFAANWYGAAGDDLGLEHDVLSGGYGDDELAIGYGDDADGGGGNDTLRLSLGGLSHGVDLDTAGIVSGSPFTLGGGVIQNIETLLYLRGTDFADHLTLATQGVMLTVNAGGGDDTIVSKGSSATISGGDGDDRFISGPAGDAFDGGSGRDTVDYGGATSAVTVDLKTGTGGGGDTLTNVEVVLGSGFGDTLRGGGSDQLFGGAGDDTISAASGGGGAYRTYLRGDEGNDSISGGSGFDDINGNMGNDTAHGNDGGDWVVGGKDNDLLYGDAGDDIVYGNLGSDTCMGGVGADLVRGGKENDVLDGGDGDDWLSGDKGDDTITGGAGADVFHTFGDAGLDRVTDFNRAQGDRVQLDPGTSYAVSQQGGDLVIDMVGGGQMVLVGVQMSTLTGDWIFGA